MPSVGCMSRCEIHSCIREKYQFQHDKLSEYEDCYQRTKAKIRAGKVDLLCHVHLRNPNVAETGPLLQVCKEAIQCVKLR